jgi:hypothetical protein
MRLLAVLLAVVLSGCSTLQVSSTSRKDWGKFDSSVKTEWLKGRDMKLLEDVRYTAPDGKEWVAPKGSRINGASIPKAFWSVLGGPYEGNYRDASVIHDVECVRKTESWQNVHYMFYTAMRAKGVSEETAKVMYAAVYRFGPRWNQKRKVTPRTPNSTDVKKIETYVQKYSPTIQKIETTESIPGVPAENARITEETSSN